MGIIKTSEKGIGNCFQILNPHILRYWSVKSQISFANIKPVGICIFKLGN